MRGLRRRIDWERAAEFAAAAAKLADERRIAAEVVPPLLEGTPLENWSALSERVELQTSGALEQLSKLFTEVLPKDPQHAYRIAELAVACAESASSRAYPAVVLAQVRAHAWKDLGIAYRTLAKLMESLEVLAIAKARLADHPALAHDLAIVNLARALTLQEVERFEEARSLLTETKKVFLDHGDVRRHVLAIFAEGVLLQRMRHYREAREVYLRLLDSRLQVDTSVVSAIHRAVGLASIELGEYADAETHLVRSIRLNRQLSQPIEAARGKYAFGRLLIRRGENERATTYLRPVRREFLENGLIEEAGLCGLEIVEGMLNLGNSAAAGTLARKIIGEFTAAGLNKRAITALGYLQEAIAASKASATLVTTVREYIVSLRTSPERDFQPSRLTASEPELGRSLEP